MLFVPEDEEQNICQDQRCPLSGLYFIFISFLFLFSFHLFSILNLGLGINMTLHKTVINCHALVTSHSHIIIQNIEHHRRFWNKIIQYILHILTLRKIHGFLGQAKVSIAQISSLAYIRLTFLYLELHQVFLY